MFGNPKNIKEKLLVYFLNHGKKSLRDMQGRNISGNKAELGILVIRNFGGNRKIRTSFGVVVPH